MKLPRLLRVTVVLMLAGGALAVAEEASGPVQRVEIDKTLQVLRAYEDERLVFQSRISTGKWDRSTPNGHFTVGEKYRMHYSKRYHNAPMPFSVQVNGHIFIHGFTQVPAWPASHGCIRMPLDGENPAKWFFDWVRPGTPIEVGGRWEKPPPQRYGPQLEGRVTFSRKNRAAALSAGAGSCLSQFVMLCAFCWRSVANYYCRVQALPTG